MRLIPEKKAVILRPRQRSKLLKLIPTSKPVVVDGKQAVAVPWKMDEVKVLNNIGADVPSPITYDYKFPRSFEIENPFDAQVQTAAMLTLNNRAYVLNDLGTGKSLAALWAYDYLRSIGKAGKLLVICPMSTMERTWADEVFYHLRHLEWRVVYGDRKRRLRLLAEDADVYIVNHHGAMIIDDALRERPDITHTVIDEISQVARNRKTDIWKAMNHIVNGAGYGNKKIVRASWGMTATPIPNEPTDAWAQVRLLTPENITPYFSRFREKVMQQWGPYSWVPRDNAVDLVHEAMQPATRWRRDECLDLPPTIYITREAKLSKEQDAAYKTMHNELAAQLESGEILAVNEAVKIGKLVQIACGVIYDSDKVEQTIGAESRLKLTAEACAESSSKTIVFVPFRSSVAYVTDYLRQQGFIVENIHGGVSKSKRDVIFSAFQKSLSPQVIVAHPGAMSHGLTLTAASTIVWYAPITNADIYEQANGRITRPGQKYTTIIINIEGTPVERRIYSKLKKKQAMQNLLLDKQSYEQAA